MYTNVDNDAAFKRDVLERIGQSWDSRVAVRKGRLDLSEYYRATLPDFPIAMVPFWNDPDFICVDHDVKLRLLAAAWVAYNEKAMYFEDEIVLPVCNLLLKGRLPGASDPLVKQVLAQVQVDEQFHILMCLDVCNVARKHHQMHDFIAPCPALGVHLSRRLSETGIDGSQAQLVRLAYASVAEMSISSYLSQVSKDMTIQPINRINTDMHRRDESAHSIAFHEIVSSVYRALGPSDQASFRGYLADALEIFSLPDVAFWESILGYAEIRNREHIIARLENIAAGTRSSRDYAVLDSFCKNLYISDMPIMPNIAQ